VTEPHDPDAGQGSPGRRRAFPRRRGWTRIALAGLVLLLVALAADVALLADRVDEVAVDLHADDSDGQTWVLVGLDSREHLPAGASVAEYGSAEDVPGTRADVVLVVHVDGDRTSVLSVPRDLMVRTDRVVPERLAVTWQRGPQVTVDALCSLGIPTDHLVTVDLAGFAAIVDSVGGLDLDVARPVRDPAAGLQIDRAGPQHVDGRTALALVRSRHTEHLVDGAWVPAPAEPEGRSAAVRTALTALAGAVHDLGTQPWRLPGVAWTVSGALTTDGSTSSVELASLAGVDPTGTSTLPADSRDGPVPVAWPTRETAQALRAAGLSCR
jgi:LCP family protein required for cell wall assembly